MGSSKVQNTKPQPTMENKSSKAISLIKSFFSKRKEKTKQHETPKIEIQKPETPNPVDSVLETFKKLDLNKPKEVKKNNEEERTEKKTEEDSEDELQNFSFKIVEDDRRSARIDSQSSEDSGFADVKAQDDVIESFGRLRLEDKDNRLEDKENRQEDKENCLEDKNSHLEDKKKKLVTLLLSRGADRTKKVTEYNTHPYNAQKDRNQINSVNKKALSGGHVTVNTALTATLPDNYAEFAKASQEVEFKSQNSQKDHDYWEDLMDYIQKDTETDNLIEELHNLENLNPELQNLIYQNSEIQNSVLPNDVLHSQQNVLQNELQNPDFLTREIQNPKFLTAEVQNPKFLTTEVQNPKFLTTDVQNSEFQNLGFQFPSPISEFANHLPNYEESVELTNTIINFDSNMSSIFPTPPRSENVPSPMSESQTSFYPSNSDYTLSPERSSPIYNSDFEKYQDISHFDDFSEKSDKKKERNSSVSSLTLKNFKDKQKDLANLFSKKECCSINRKSCKEIFDEHMSKLKAEERKNLCLQASKVDLRTCYGVLQNVLLSLSRGSEQEDLNVALFVLLAQRVLMQSPNLYLGDFGLNLLKSSALRCPHRPFLTRVIVECVYMAAKGETASRDFIFHEVDAQGDNLIIACARGGDEFALVLAELTTRNTPPLFKLEHVNSDGYTALHVACSLHATASPRLHTVHVLLDHANVDLWKGDAKGGDTALHLAVNSVNCDLNLILLLFRHLDRKLWKKLAHYQNMSSVTPLEYARSATRSTTRENYPQQVLSFLMKCR